jgi:hypothetical protein
MWKVSRIQGFKNKWAVSKDGSLKGYVAVHNERIEGNIDMSGEDQFAIVNTVQDLIADEIAEEQLLMNN